MDIATFLAIINLIQFFISYHTSGSKNSYQLFIVTFPVPFVDKLIIISFIVIIIAAVFLGS